MIEKYPAIEVYQWSDIKDVPIIAYGGAMVLCDGEVVYDGIYADIEDHLKFQDVEFLAQKEPEKDWRVWFSTNFHEEEYQRQGDCNWVLIKWIINEKS